MTVVDAKRGLKEFAQGRREIFMIDPRQIMVEAGFNARDFAISENAAHVDLLRQSIVENGIKVPLTVRLDKGAVMLVDGECRLRAVLSAIEQGHEIVAIPCQSEDRATNAEQRLVEQVTRNTGKPFTPLELASIATRLANFGWSQEAIAKKLCVTASYVSTLINRIAALPVAAQDIVRSGEVSVSAAIEAVRDQGDEAGVATIREAVETSKAAGKKRATVGRVRATAAKNMPSSKPTGMTLNTVKTERVTAFLRAVLTNKFDDLAAVKAAADEVLTEILR